MLYSRKYRLVPVTVQTVDEAREKKRENALDAILKDRSLGSGERMAVYEDALVRKINSEAKPGVETALQSSALPSLSTPVAKRKRQPANSPDELSFDATQTNVRTASSRKMSPQPADRTPVIFSPATPNVSFGDAKIDENVGRSRQRERNAHPRKGRHHARSRDESIPSRSPENVSRKALSWQSKLGKKLMAGMTPLKSRRIFQGRLEVTPRSVLTPRHTRSGKQIGAGRMRIQSW